jgi:hypothetical protein
MYATEGNSEEELCYRDLAAAEIGSEKETDSKSYCERYAKKGEGLCEIT